MNLFATVREGSPDDEPLIERAEEDNQPLSKINYLPQWNTVAFLVNIIVTYGVGTLGWLGKGINNAELSEKYQVSTFFGNVAGSMRPSLSSVPPQTDDLSPFCPYP